MSPADELASLLNKGNDIGLGTTGVSAPSIEQQDKIARAVYALVAHKAGPVFSRKLQQWPDLIEDTDDLQQIAVVAFIRSYAAGKLRPDPVSGEHTVDSVSAYLWGICKRVFAEMVRRRHPAGTLDASGELESWAPIAPGLLSELEGNESGDDEARLWKILSSVAAQCRPEHIILAWLHSNGFTPAEICQLTGVGLRGPAKATQTVGNELRQILGLAGSQALTRPRSRHQRDRKAASTAPARDPGYVESLDADVLVLLTTKQWDELLILMSNPEMRNRLLLQATIHLDPARRDSAKIAFAARRARVVGSADWTWGLLTRQERLLLLHRDLSFMLGSGRADGGRAQLAALTRLRPKLADIYQELDMAQTEKDEAWLLPLAEYLSPLLEVVSEFKEMRARYMSLLSGAEGINSPRLKLLALIGLSRAELRLGQQEASRTAAQSALSLAIGLADRYCEATALNALGLVEYVQTNCAQAIILFEQSLAIRQEIDDRRGQAASINNLGSMERHLGNHAAALQRYAQAVCIEREIGNRYGEAMSLANQARVLFTMGEFERARPLYAHSLKIQREIGDLQGESLTLNNLGVLESTEENFFVAQTLLLQSLDIRREIGDRPGEAMSLTNLGANEVAQGALGTAGQLLLQALEINREIGNPQGEATSLGLLGVLELQLGNSEQALTLLTDSLIIFKESGDAAGAMIYCACSALLLALRGDLAAAAVSLSGAQSAGTRIGSSFNFAFIWAMKSGQAAIDDALAAGRISVVDMASLRARGAAMTLVQVTDFTLAALKRTRAESTPV